MRKRGASAGGGIADLDRDGVAIPKPEPPRTVTEALERWHAAYDDAVLQGREPDEAVRAADRAVPSAPPLPAPSVDHVARDGSPIRMTMYGAGGYGKTWAIRDSVRVALRKGPVRVASYGEIGMPTDMEYEIVTLSSSDLQKAALRKQTEDELPPNMSVRDAREFLGQSILDIAEDAG